MSLPRHPGYVLAMRPIEALFRAVVARRNARYDRGVGVVRAGIPVVSVGNLTVGGTGKTPAAAWIVKRLAERGRRPAVVSRGYGGAAGAGPVVVSPSSRCEEVGDEPVLLSELTRSIVVVGSDRAAGVRKASELGADVAVLDDGFQHRRLARDLDVVLLDAAEPFGNGRLLPAGPLREPPAALFRAGIVVLTRADAAGAADGESSVRALRLPAPIVRAVHAPAGFSIAGGGTAPAPARAVAFAGIARPASFRESLRETGVEVVSFRAFPDHHPYRPAEVLPLFETARREGVAVVTTRKDRVRLPEEVRGQALALDVELRPEDPRVLDAALDRVLEDRR